jgi:hypothetical protein
MPKRMTNPKAEGAALKENEKSCFGGCSQFLTYLSKKKLILKICSHDFLPALSEESVKHEVLENLYSVLLSLNSKI